MPRFFFNIITADGPIVDFEGTELPDVDGARSEAIADARALMSNAMREGRTIFGWSIEITDENGDILVVLPFTEAVTQAD